MTNLQIGSLVLSAELLVFAAAAAAGAAMALLRLRRLAGGEAAAAAPWNAVWLWLAIWKGSLLLFDPGGVWSEPAALLYFGGGSRGVWLASAVSAGYLFYRCARAVGVASGGLVTAVAATGWLTVWSLGRLLLAQPTDPVDLPVFLLSAAATLALLAPALPMRWKQRLVLLFRANRRAAQWAIVLLLAAGVGYAVYDQFDDARPADGLAEPDGTRPVGVRSGEQAPDFRLATLDGDEVRLSDYRGQTVLVNFWATWCRVCKAEMPHLEKLYQEYRDKGVMVLSVNVTSEERSEKAVAEYRDKRGLSFPILLDGKGQVADVYRAAAYPTTVVVDADGVVVKHHVGAIHYEEMARAVRRSQSSAEG